MVEYILIVFENYRNYHSSSIFIYLYKTRIKNNKKSIGLIKNVNYKLI